MQLEHNRTVNFERMAQVASTGLQPQLDAHPDATLAEHCLMWETTKADAGQFCHDESCDPPDELDPEEKNVTCE
jgi:hypothetical protein